MNLPVRITSLVENTASGRGLLGEHGLSFWIERGDARILFDTGQGDVFAHNARLLKINLAQADAIVLSHGHYDHSGGLAKAMQLAQRARVFLHPDALRPKFSRHADGTCHDVGLPRLDEMAIRQRSGLVFTEGPMELAEGVFATGPIPRRNAFEDTGGAFFGDTACTQPDPLEDDQALYIRTPKGLVVLLGCAHAGVINTLDHARAVSGVEEIHAVIGGMHLHAASEERLAATIDALQQHEDLIIAPAHCTGLKPTMLLWYRFPRRCRPCCVGSQFLFE